ncbi:YceI family protein [Parvularcula maris]|uniref:YceI family protein n=1 Tax=Parvularcula maris TaxID=2965077 RepID=A0A9X2RI20_9PROT|nr:YceI family protein [Parvularcula maris]MCQ8185580.1 YceI family protein [Parvularcula maris]
MTKFLAAAVSTIALSSAAFAQDVPSGEYKLDPTHTTVVWSVAHGPFSMYRGSFETIEGTLTYNSRRPARSELTVSIDANSVDSPEAVSHAGNANFQEDIAKNALGADANPQITFTTTSLKKTGEGEGTVTGDLTLNGVTKPVTMEVQLRGAGDFMGSPRIGFTGETTIDRTEFGSDAWTQFGVGKDVTITVEAEFAQAQ